MYISSCFVLIIHGLLCKSISNVVEQRCLYYSMFIEYTLGGTSYRFGQNWSWYPPECGWTTLFVLFDVHRNGWPIHPVVASYRLCTSCIGMMCKYCETLPYVMDYSGLLSIWLNNVYNLVELYISILIGRLWWRVLCVNQDWKKTLKVFFQSWFGFAWEGIERNVICSYTRLLMYRNRDGWQ
jgi:hypothetical protein